MTSILDTVAPKSDQLNFDDFIGGHTKTIKITNVEKVGGDQPVNIHYENDNGKPWKPCKSMRRVMIRCWNDNIETWIGKSLTLFGDPKVKWAGKEEGGIRISHISDITHEITMALTETRSNRKPFTVKSLVVEAVVESAPDAEVIKGLQLRASEAASKGSASLDAFLKALPANEKKHLAHFGKEIRAQAVAADEAASQ